MEHQKTTRHKSDKLVKLLGGPVDQKRDLARDASPVTWVSKESAPLYIEQGTRNPLVPFNQSERLAAKYRKAGVEVTLDLIPGAGHGGTEFLNQARVAKLLAFLNKHVGHDVGQPVGHTAAAAPAAAAK